MGNWEQRLQFYLKNKSITPIERQRIRSFCVHSWKAWSCTVLKRVKIFGTKGLVLNTDKRNSRRGRVVHKETKPSPSRKGIVSCETQYSKTTGYGSTARQRIRELTWHRSFMQTDLTHTTSNMLNAPDKEEKILKMGDNSYSKTAFLNIIFQSPTSHIRILSLFFSFVSLLRIRLQVSSQQTFSGKSQTINILGFTGHSVHVATTQLHHCSMTAATDKS